MPEFAHPVFLLLLPLVPFAVRSWLWRRRPVLRWPDRRLIENLPHGRTRRARWMEASLFGLGVTSLILALAGPRWPDRGSRLPVEGIAIALALDVSGSMAEPDFDWEGAPVSRMTAAQRSIRNFVLGDSNQPASRANDHIALVAFAAQPEDTCPLTLSHDALMKLIEAEEPRGLPETGTNIGDAIVWALKSLEAAGDRRKIIVLVTDGEHNTPAPALSPRQAGQLAAAKNTPIYTIVAGPQPGAEQPGSDAAARRAGQNALASVASMTGGRSFLAHDALGLRNALADIDRLERSPGVSFQYRRYRETHGMLALAALVLFSLMLGLHATVWRRCP
jgi:Ca-activated chloride channel family protein